MNKQDIIRAWKDKAYRQSLSREQQTALPEHPAGEIELVEEDLHAVHAAAIPIMPDSTTEGCDPTPRTPPPVW